MTQDERWIIRCQKVKNFIEERHRNATRHRIEEHLTHMDQDESEVDGY